MEFSERLIKYIDEKGITVKELAEEMGVNKSTLSVWIQSGTKPAIRWHKKLEEFFGLSAKELGIERYCERCGGALIKEGTRYCEKCGNKRERRARNLKTGARKPYPPDKRCANCKFWDKAISDNGGCIQILERGHGMRKTDEAGKCMQYEAKADGRKRELKELGFNREHIGKRQGHIITPYDFEKVMMR